MFGKVREVPQRENYAVPSAFAYGISKVAGFELTRNYREALWNVLRERDFSTMSRLVEALNLSRARSRQLPRA